VDKFSAESRVNVLAGKRREEPGGAFEKIGVRKLHAGVLFARHGMAGEKSLTGISPKRFRGVLNNFRLRAAHVGHESLERKRRTEPVDQIENREHGRCQHHQIASMYGISGIRGPTVDGAAALGALQNWGAVAADDSGGEMTLLEREPERASDQAGSDDGDLFERHL
jgi:hypothetical protein